MTEDATNMGALYRSLAVDWESARDDPDEANRLFREHHALYKRLRETAVGRAAISGLLDDPVAAVRLLAATHSLVWDEERAARVLEELQSEGSPVAVDAKWTLRSYRSGTLDLDWYEGDTASSDGA